MAGIWNEVGYSARGRMQLTDRIRAGQFQTGRVNVFMRPNHTNINIINNGYDMMPPPPPYEEPEMSGTMKAAMWTGIGGAFLRAIGNIITAWGGSHKDAKVEGQGSTKAEVSAEDSLKKDLAAFKEAYKDNCKISGPLSDGSYIIIDKKTGKRITATDFDDLKAKLQEYDNDETTVNALEKPKVEEAPVTVNNNADTSGFDAIKALYNANSSQVNGNLPINANDFTADTLQSADFKNSFKGVFDHGLNGQFKDAKITEVNGDTVKMSNGHTYKMESNGGCIYLRDMSTGSGNNQVYILEKNSDGTYSLHQRNFLGDNTDGYGFPAQRNGQIVTERDA